MSAALAQRLEALSGYRHVFSPQDASGELNPVVHSHLLLEVGGRRCHVLSRICDAGLDYTQRTNKFAHHVVLDASEAVPGGPAWLLGLEGFMQAAWDGEPRMLPVGRAPPAGNPPPGVCHAWQRLTGDAGWGGVLAETATTGLPAVLIFRPGMDMLPLVAEALALLPPALRWNVSFSTYLNKLPPGVDCQWRCVLDGNAEAVAAGRVPRALVLDLSAGLGPARDGAYVHAARTGAPVPTAPKAWVADDSDLSRLLGGAMAAPATLPAAPVVGGVPGSRLPGGETYSLKPQRPDSPVPLAGPPPLRRFKRKPKPRWPWVAGLTAAAVILATGITAAWFAGHNRPTRETAEAARVGVPPSKPETKIEEPKPETKPEAKTKPKPKARTQAKEEPRPETKTETREKPKPEQEKPEIKKEESKPEQEKPEIKKEEPRPESPPKGKSESPLEALAKLPAYVELPASEVNAVSAQASGGKKTGNGNWTAITKMKLGIGDRASFTMKPGREKGARAWVCLPADNPAGRDDSDLEFAKFTLQKDRLLFEWLGGTRLVKKSEELRKYPLCVTAGDHTKVVLLDRPKKCEPISVDLTAERGKTARKGKPVADWLGFPKDEPYKIKRLPLRLGGTPDDVRVADVDGGGEAFEVRGFGPGPVRFCLRLEVENIGEGQQPRLPPNLEYIGVKLRDQDNWGKTAFGKRLLKEAVEGGYVPVRPKDVDDYENTLRAIGKGIEQEERKSEKNGKRSAEIDQEIKKLDAEKLDYQSIEGQVKQLKSTFGRLKSAKLGYRICIHVLDQEVTLYTTEDPPPKSGGVQ
jgi:outer membrane biosynthesis protein TonB